ncbi:MAG TPA: sigma-70 family RNA polymerase sigma factor [Gaiellales bacterium]|nr:sigma-70 family RNA polymerase sigma factor [Gaiellales bacterium]
MAPTPPGPAGRARPRPQIPHDVARRLVRAAAAGDRDARERLVEAYRPLIARIAHGRGASVPTSMDADDLASCGLIALNQSIDRYDGGGVDFESYALIRVRGAITDHLRELDWAPRRVRSEARRLRAVEQTFAASHGRMPSDREVAAVASLTPEQVSGIRREVASSQVLSLNVRVSSWDPGDGTELVDAIVDETADDPCAAALRGCQAERIRVAIDRLGTRDRDIFRDAVLNGVPSTRLATIHGITEGRVSQILRRIREQIGNSLVDQFAV